MEMAGNFSTQKRVGMRAGITLVYITRWIRPFKKHATIIILGIRRSMSAEQLNERPRIAFLVLLDGRNGFPGKLESL